MSTPKINPGRVSLALRAAIVVSAFGYIAQALSLVAIPLYLGSIGAEGYGLLVAVLACAAYLGFAEGGMGWGAMIMIAQACGRGAKNEIAHIVRHSAVVAAASGVLLAATVGALLAASAAGLNLPLFESHPGSHRLLLIVAVQLAIQLQCGVCFNLAQGLQESAIPAIYQGIGRVLGVLGAIFAARASGQVEAVLAAQFAGASLCAILGAVHIWRRHPWAFVAGSVNDANQYRAQFKVGAKNFVLQIGRTFSATAPTLGIGSLVGAAAVPFYSVPMTLLSLFFQPVTSWSMLMQSGYGEAWVAGETRWVRETFRESLQRLALVSALGVALFLALGDDFIRLWTRDRLWLDPAMAVSVALIGVVGAALAAGQFLLSGLNRHRAASAGELASGILSFAFVYLAVAQMGAAGVGPGFVVAVAVSSGWVLWREIRRLLGAGFAPRAAFLLRTALAAVATYVSCRFITSSPWVAEVTSSWMTLIAGGGVGLLTFAFSVAALRLLPLTEVRTLVRQCLGRRARVPALAETDGGEFGKALDVKTPAASSS